MDPLKTPSGGVWGSKYILTKYLEGLGYILLGGGVHFFLYVHPYLGKIPILTNIFSKGLVQPPTSISCVCLHHVFFPPVMDSVCLFAQCDAEICPVKLSFDVMTGKLKTNQTPNSPQGVYDWMSRALHVISIK